MTYQGAPYSYFLFVEVTALLAVGCYLAWEWYVDRQRSIGTSAVLLLSGGVWVLGHAMSLSSTTLAGKLFWQRFEFVGLAVLPTVWFLFVLYYTRRTKWLSRRAIAAFCTPAVAFLLLGFTNDWHGLLIESATLTQRGSMVLLDATFGLLYHAFIVYDFVLVLSTIVLLLYVFIDSTGFYRVQAGLFLGSSSLISLAGVLAIFEFEPFPGLDVTTVAIGVIVIPVLASVFDERIFVANPVGKNAIVAELQDPILTVDERGRIIDLNPAAADLCDTDRSDAINESLESVLPAVAAGIRASRRGETVDSELTIGEGEATKHFDLKVSSLGGGDHVAILREVTEQKAREAALREQNRRLDEFASVVAHDLRNPLNASMGWVEVAMDAEDDEEYLRKIAQANERMEQIVEDLLTLARSDSQALETTTVPLRKAALAAWETVASEEATVEVADDLPSVEGTEGRLSELFENLFRNAIQHGGPDVHVTVTPREGGGFVVADDGAGIPPEERETVFDHGYTSAREGTGLGLSIVEEIAAAHGWTVEVTESEAGGAAFVFERHDGERPPESG